MKKAMRSVIVPFLLAAATLAGASGLSAPQPPAPPKPMHGLGLTAQVRGAVPVLVAAKPGQAGAVARTVLRLGGEVVSSQPDYDFLFVRLPAARAAELERSSAVRSVGLDRTVWLDQGAMRPLDERPSVSPPSGSDPGLSLRITRGEIRAAQFTAQTGSDGAGTLIALLDTGVDPVHPALLTTTDGQRKLADWQDFTGEGDVLLSEEQGEPVSGIRSLSGRYRVGSFREYQIPAGELASDIDRNGRSGDSFGVLAVDTQKAGLYDTVYVDTDADGSFADERPMRPFSSSGDVAVFGAAGPDGRRAGVSFVVTRIHPGGESVNLGYDGGQHGTHVAGIAAGSGPVVGVAPGARLMAIKVLTSAGAGDWSGIARGILYAAEHGADVINLSLGGLSEQNDGSDPLSLLIQEVADRTGVLFSIAAGNTGPGLNTVGVPGVAGAAITSGAFISSKTWKADYGLNVPGDGLWYFSGAGPRADGGLKPNVVAPGAANAPIPTWAGDYAVFQGTSMAAPQTAGAAALLIGAARQQGLSATGSQVKTALEQGARRLSGYGWFEQGYGLIQVDAAWKRLIQMRTAARLPDLLSFGPGADGTPGTGTYARSAPLTPKALTWSLGNRGRQPVTLDLSYLPGSGLTLSGPQQSSLPPLGLGAVPLLAQHPKAPGVYDGLAEGWVRGESAPAVRYLVTVVVPHRFEPQQGHSIGIAGSLAPARYARHFVQVPEGTAELTVQLTVPGNRGRIRLLLFTPAGIPWGSPGPWAGAPLGPDRQRATVSRPQPGVWEIVAYASHGAMTWNLAQNEYVIDVAARGVYAVPNRLSLPPAFGRQLTAGVTFTNCYGEIQAALLGAGFARPETWRLEVEDGGSVVQILAVPEATALLRTAIEQVAGSDASLRLNLYYLDERALEWVRVGQRSGRAPVQEWELQNPAPGVYAVELLGVRVPGGRTAVQLSQTLVRVGGEEVAPAGGTALRRFGAVWGSAVTLNLPVEPGRYTGAILLRDERTGKALAVIPIDIEQ